MQAATYKIAPGIELSQSCHYIVSVNQEDFGMVSTRAEAISLVDRLADVLLRELSEDPLVAEGWMRIEKDIGDHEIVVSRQMLGKWVNSSMTPVYRLSCRAIASAVLVDPRSIGEVQYPVREDVPSYAHIVEREPEQPKSVQTAVADLDALVEDLTRTLDAYFPDSRVS